MKQRLSDWNRVNRWNPVNPGLQVGKSAYREQREAQQSHGAAGEAEAFFAVRGVSEVPEVVACRNLLDKVRCRPVPLCSGMLIEPRPLSQQIEAGFVLIELAERAVRKPAVGQDMCRFFRSGWIASAPVEDR